MAARYSSIRSRIIEQVYLQCLKMLEPPEFDVVFIPYPEIDIDDPILPDPDDFGNIVEIRDVNRGVEYRRLIGIENPDYERGVDDRERLYYDATGEEIKPEDPGFPCPKGAAPTDFERYIIGSLDAPVKIDENSSDADKAKYSFTNSNGVLREINSHLKCVFVGMIEPQKIEDADMYPALFIEHGSEGYKPRSGGTRQGVEHSSDVEIIPITIRLLTKDYRIQKSSIAGSNPIQVSEIREVLDFLLDPRYFRGIVHDRAGYSMNSIVKDAGIVYARNNEGLRHPVEMNDLRFEVEIQQQKEVDADISLETGLLYGETGTNP